MSRKPDANDPFWSVVAERHPDLDIVVLPAEAPPTPTSVDAEEVERRRLALDAAVMHLNDMLAPHAELSAADTVPGPVVDSVRWRSKASGVVVDGAELLDRLAAPLTDVVRRGGAVEQLDAEIDGFRVRATWASVTEVLVVRVESEALRVDADETTGDS